MIQFEKIVLKNGLRVIIHKDISTPMVAVNVLYDVGSRDEHPERTGFAHLFEHLMFGGSIHIPDFDAPIQLAGGENNAFTTMDITNFYDIIPAANIETALWLESDRMLGLAFGEKSLKVQKKVVVEEFKETCLNEPYGDLWHHISALAYKVHPYRWPTIGLIPDHIKDATLEEVKHFFYTHYCPQNAILVISGNIDVDQAFKLSEKWFGDIPSGERPTRNLPIESRQEEYRFLEIKAPVPMVSLNLAFPMPGRKHCDFYVYDLLSDVLSNGQSSRLQKKLVTELNVFSDVDAFISGTIDPGLFMITGKPMPGVHVEEARKLLWSELETLMHKKLKAKELQKLKNKAESTLVFSEISALYKAMNLAYFEVLGDASLINQEADSYRNVEPEDLQRTASDLFRKENCNEVVYMPS